MLAQTSKAHVQINAAPTPPFCVLALQMGFVIRLRVEAEPTTHSVHDSLPDPAKWKRHNIDVGETGKTQLIM